MKLFKWWVLPAAAVAVLVLLAGCEKPDEDAFTGSERARLRDNAEREKASQSLTSALLKTSQALALAQNGIQLKLQGVATLDGQAARLEPPPAPPAATTPGAPPAEPKAPET
ncbi:MAG: hypothetical protein HYU66_25420, partial [Armatimonadetes bacterium]|nr:hypothetical protein [Armatimonadota bacterium]